MAAKEAARKKAEAKAARKNSLLQVARMRKRFMMKAKKAREQTDSWGAEALEADDWEARLSKDDEQGSESSASDDDDEESEEKRREREREAQEKKDGEELEKLKELTKRIHEEEQGYDAAEAYKKEHESDVDQLEREWEEQQAWFAKVERESALHEHEKEHERLGI
jgi:hypothetical protein